MLLQTSAYYFSPSALYIQTLLCSTLMCINSYCSDSWQDIKTSTDQNYLLSVVPQVLLFTWGTVDGLTWACSLHEPILVGSFLWNQNFKENFLRVSFRYMPVFPKNSV